MNDLFDAICATEDALQTLEVLATVNRTEVMVATELQRLEDRLRYLQNLAPVFVQRV